MWVCSALGFFNIVKKREPGAWQIRSRCRDDLDTLASAAKLRTEVITIPNSDYAFHLLVDESGLSRVFSTLADSITYANCWTYPRP